MLYFTVSWQSYMFAPSKHIHLICHCCSLCLVVIDLTGKSTTGLLYLHGWEGQAMSRQGDRWRPADGTPGNATFVIVILVATHPLIMSTPPTVPPFPLSFFIVFINWLIAVTQCEDLSAYCRFCISCPCSYNAIKSKDTALALLLPIVNLEHQMECFIYPFDMFSLVYMGKIPSQTLMSGRPLKK